MSIMKKWPYVLLVVASGLAAVMFIPTEEKVRHNVVNSKAGNHGAAAKSKSDSARTPEGDSGTANTGTGEGNSAGMPLRIINNAPNFNQILAAAQIVNGGVEQKDSAQFVQISTAKHIAELQAELAKLQAQIAESNARKAEMDKKLQTEEEKPKSDVSAGNEFVLPEETPLDDIAEAKSQGAGVIPFTANAGNGDKESDKRSAKEPSVSYSRNIKLKGMTGDGRVALQLGNDFALNVEEGQVVWTRYRIEKVDTADNCVTYTDMRVKGSRGQACYN